MIEPWFPKSYRLSERFVLKKIIYDNSLWQIYSANNDQSVLIVKDSLYNFWQNQGLKLYEFELIEFGEKYHYFSCSSEYIIKSVSENSESPTFTDAISFASSLAHTRELGISESLENALFVEKLSLLLPMPNQNKNFDDKRVLGTWLTGGVNVSVDNKSRMKQLMGNISRDEFKEIIKAAKLDDTNNENTKVSVATESPKEKSETSRYKGKKTFSLPGRLELENFIKDHVIDIIEKADKYKRMGIEFPSAFILQGPPGCGKTYAVEKLTEYLDWPCYYIESGSVGSPFIHDTSRKISEVFDTAIENAPSVVIIDEMESFLSSRESSMQNHHLEEIGEFLRRIPEARAKNVLVVAMTNMMDAIDPAIKRKGRFDHIIEVGMPSEVEIKMVIENYLNNIPHSDKINIDEVSKRLVGHSMADVNYLLRESARLTVKYNKDLIEPAIFDEILKDMQKETPKKKSLGFKPNTS